ncbi:shikimate dehydrogenase [Clostridium magnum]|uniref:Shikimate dehydrogenase (NADP(+)) n=1 Tax=Clostridium magnum DSM 2767 TaxID=1121326 RepID=A0A162R3E4_9CLOT|nr:shikimate dehydrogenase [Clostridium magnum]KZL89369.1 shikimate dehydrogenase [Clostridium magnum DSM 2767]SHI20957.1 shikimate dehydrogenase [Clostridium magnum DSM 2767]
MSNFYGLIGEKLGHSLSPEIHNLIFKNINSKGLYNLLEIKREDLENAIWGLKALGCKGANVTIPYKIQVMQYLDSISEEAGKIGAVNTISFNNGVLTGYNTDYHGFGAALKRKQIDINNKKAVILGCGGASKAVVQYLIDNRINDIIYVSRDPQNTAKDTKNLKVISYDDIETLTNQDIIINCTPCGMYPSIEYCPVKENILSKFSVAIDLIYNPQETLFLKQSRELGLKTENGLYMLVAQAVAAQEIWQNIKINEESIDEIYLELKNRFV